MSNAEKEAIAQGRPVEVSWAELNEAQSAKVHEAALLHAYKGKHRGLPGIEGRDGKWVRGNKRVENKKGSLDALAWCGWHPMEPRTIELIPPKPGVYRIQVA